ncbi:exodeoxyribonuclease V subunit gamma [Pseudoxanthomonas wuyuanensis]|uniref:RecBCD enzyme subunit RecC n=1 Tax=Pseudoxanthomonas wuyuanensis TaxID=1073196 RepID=A0A286DF49_9GAMM|nr:exodeoxyribonuclease V subunit gamma [Pseudoxanthomonas wuyuanensis]KAF1719931.1 exodeoxyribonuclease V subunit gamma [Pseudoxanthomonas wuyuanensis]SOD57221.1 DNA helicase/exodeoxyribonuclease V, gamma subunit [Pseudoxanthomonas wuyuanensis]
MQGPPHDFRLYPSNDLDVLAGVLASRLRGGADDWWRQEVVLVPQFSMRRWLQQTLAEQLGICAHVAFLTPGEFVDLALDANLGEAPRGDRLAPETLRWHLLRELQDDAPAEFAGFAAHADPRYRWSLACALADSFEKYQAWRRDLLLAWERRAPREDGQATLWQRIGRGRRHRARRIGEYLRRFGPEGADAPAGLPPRLFVFACQNISPDVLQVVASQARAGEQHFFLHTPSRVYWGDLSRWAADYRPDQDDRFGGENPLLAAWGQAGRDFIAALGGGETVRARFEAPAFSEPYDDQLLGRLQTDVLENRAPLAGEASGRWPRARVDVADASLQFHACHTRLREVQVLHDQLRALLEQEASHGRPRIDPRDIAVLMPDVDAYAPHVEAVFGGALGSAREIPYTIADTSPLASAAVAETFLRLLKLPLQPLTLPDLIDLLAVPALAQRFDIEDADRARLQDWLQAAGARWGLDGADRARHLAPPAASAPEGGGDPSARETNGYTFEFALDRLLLGMASGDDALIGGAFAGAQPAVAPWPELEGQATDSLDALVRLLAALRGFGARLHGPHTPKQWANQLAELLAAVFAAEPREDGERVVLERLHKAVADFADSAALADFERQVAHSVVLDHFQAELAGSDARAPFLSGGVCFGRMVPMRLIPFRVICLLGMEEAAFPARDGRDPVNRINQALEGPDRRVGDPSRRDADRYLFLQLFSSASRAFYTSWVGMDARDGSRREPSVLVSELLDAAARYHQGDAETVREQLVVRHALQPFSPAAFGAALPEETQGDARRFSFDARWHPAAGADTGTGRAESEVFAAVLPAREEEAGNAVSLAQLRDALMRPHAFYLQAGLGLRLPEEESPPQEHEPFGMPDALSRHGLRQLVFDAWRRAGAAPALAPLQAGLLARGLLAPGADGRAVLRGIVEEVAPFADAAVQAGFAGDGDARPLELALPEPAAGQCVLTGTLDRVHGDRMFRAALNPNGRHGGHALRHGLDWLAASTQGLALHELSAERKGAPPRIAVRDPLPPAHARAVLAALLALRRRAMRFPLCFLPKSGHVWWSMAQQDPERALDEAQKTWGGGEGDFGGPGEAQAATRIALRGRDPFLDGDADARDAFELLSHSIFSALEQGQPFDAEALP